MNDDSYLQAPHCTSAVTVHTIMFDTVIALLPAVIAGVAFFGYRAAVMVCVCVCFCVAFELFWQKLTKKAYTVYDLSAVVTGILLALNLPPSLPFEIAVVGCFFAIIVAKQLFGGLGKNVLNPALTARFLLFIFWNEQMTKWSATSQILPFFNTNAVVKSPSSFEILKSGTGIYPRVSQLFFGAGIAGCIGETSIFAIVLGGVYLLLKKIISPKIPLSYILTVCFVTFVFGGGSLFTGDWLYHLLSGGLVLGALFMANDYATTPMAPKGQILFGIGCGLITSLVRICSPDVTGGVMYAILFMNLTVVIIDYFIARRRFGETTLLEIFLSHYSKLFRRY